MSLVSVIVPVYNAGRKLHKCIQSVLGQTYGDFTLILVNDGSTDDSLRICQSYARVDARIRLLDLPANRGSSAARRRGIEASDSPYLLFVDADDWLDRRMLGKLAEKAQASGADITVCNTWRALGGSSVIVKRNSSPYLNNERLYVGEEIKSELAAAYLHGHPFPAAMHAKLYKRELPAACGAFAERIRFFGDDLYCNLEMFLQAESVLVMPEPLYYYRTGGSTSRYMPDLFRDAAAGYAIQKETIERHYPDSRLRELGGASVMLLNTLLTCLRNLHDGPMDGRQRRETMRTYCRDAAVLECLEHAAAARYFDPALLEAIRCGDAEYLDRIARKLHRKHAGRRLLLNAVAKITF